MKKLKVITCAGVQYCEPKSFLAKEGECPDDCVQFRYTLHAQSGYKNTHDIFIKSGKRNAREKFLTLLNYWNSTDLEGGYTYIGVL